MSKTFLQLCGEVARESGAVGSAPATVLNQTGRQAKVVEWVRQANYQIMADQPDWSFLRTEFTGQLAPGVTSYDPSTFSIGDFSKWLADTPEYQPMTLFVPGDQADEVALAQIAYQSWRVSFDRGSPPQAQPVYWGIAPDGSFLVGPPPDQIYTVRGEYQAGPQTLAQDGDTSLIPAQYESAIVWRACMMLALHDEAPSAYQAASVKYAAVLTNMLRDLLPAIDTGGNALA